MKSSLVLIAIMPFLFGCSSSTSSNSVTDTASSASLPSKPASTSTSPLENLGPGETKLGVATLGQYVDDLKFTSYKVNKLLSVGLMDHAVNHGIFMDYADQKIEVIQGKAQDYTSIKVTGTVPLGVSFDLGTVKISPQGKLFGRVLNLGGASLFESGLEFLLNAKLTKNASSSVSFSHTEHHFGANNKFMIEILGNF